jgi:hypothetical protein
MSQYLRAWRSSKDHFGWLPVRLELKRNEQGNDSRDESITQQIDRRAKRKLE